MKLLRKTFTRKLFAILAGLTFLNMGFVIAEFDALGLSKQSALIQNLVNCGVEEEKETAPEGGEADDTFDEMDLSIHELMNHSVLIYELNQNQDLDHLNLSVEPGYHENFSPPPEV
jgi:hypothetical protein